MSAVKYQSQFKSNYTGKDPVALAEFQAIEEALARPKTQDQFAVMYALPDKTFPGQIIVVDGVVANPGSGEGMYRRNLANTNWVFIG